MDYSSCQTVKSLSFGIFTSEEIRKLSVLDITNTEILDKLENPTSEGLHDLRLGPNDEKDELCSTCNKNFFNCPGHPGHITLPVTVYNPVFFPELYKILCGSCLNCHRLVASESQLCLVYYQFQALDYGLVNIVEELAEIIDASEKISKIKRKLQQKFEEAIQGLSLDDKNQTKSVVECQREIRKNIITKMKKVTKCPHCKMLRKKLINKSDTRLVYNENIRAHKSTSVSKNDSEMITSELKNKEILLKDVREHMLLLWENDKIVLQNLHKILQKVSIDMFFMDLIMVPPSKFRRLNVVKGRKYPDSQTTLLNDILKDCCAVRNMLKFVNKMPLDDNEKDAINKVFGKTPDDKLNFLCRTLQSHVNELFDSDSNKTITKHSKGIKQMLESKEGIFRMNMMGKRVNYAARSVIAPDPYININEIGIPMIFAKKLTYPEPISDWNYLKLRQAVKNGPDIHPGATLVEYENGRVVRLTSTSFAQRQAIANTLMAPQVNGEKLKKVKNVHRHLRDGDMLLLNRQPTLHKPSIMAHKARVLPGEKILRLHYASCKSYNADFDGDEMNVHFPQSYSGQSECHHIVNVNHQYLVPKDGTPLSGLIQDHIIAGVLLTIRGCFFSKDKYQQLLYSALSFLPKRLKLLPPAIIKPEKLWSGKQIVSSLILNLIPEGESPPTVEGKSKISCKNWKNSPPRSWKAGGTPFNGHNMCESEVIIRDGELLSGVIDKAHVGPTPYSLIHVCYELYGGEISSRMLSSFTQLFTHYLQYYSGFSLGVEDIIIKKEADDQRKKILEKASAKGFIASAKALEVENPEGPDTEELSRKYKAAHHNRDDFQLKTLDNEMKCVTEELTSTIKNVCMPTGLIKTFPKNNLQLMIESGAKGTSINPMQISANLGQIDLEGQRPRPMLNGSTLPSFKPYDTSPVSGGFVSGCFLIGLNPQEYFFHCMAGREGLIDTAVKTSRSGYLQRSLIKHLEGIMVNYDLTVRDSDGTVIQFLYGEDGLDVLKSQMLKEKGLPLLAQNYKSAVNEEHVKILKSRVDVDLQNLKKQRITWKQKHSNPICRTALFKKAGSRNMTVPKRLRILNAMRKEVDDFTLKEFKKCNEKCPDPVNAYHRPDLVFGSVSEKLDEIILNYVNKNIIQRCATSHEKHLLSEKFIDFYHYQALRSLAEPGETVGLLAAQSIGEPSTQMTLNTFHFAGKGEMNVTLGIPRLQEILMTASSNIATPMMNLPLLDKPGILQEAEKLALKLNPVSLKQVLDSIKVREYLSIHSHLLDNFNTHVYVIRLDFLKHSDYKGFIYTTPAKILHYIEDKFLKKFINNLKKAIEAKQKRQTSASKLVDTRKDSKVFRKFTEVEEDGEKANPATYEPSEQHDEGESPDSENDDDGDTTKSNIEQEYDDLEREEDEKEGGVLSDEDKQPVEFSVPENVVSAQDKELRIKAVKKIHSSVLDYDFDSKEASWCEISLQVKLSSIKIDMKTLLEEEVSTAYVHSVKNIKQALLVKNLDARNGCNMMIKTSGVNFLDIFQYGDILDVNKAYSNDIHAIRTVFGIEAAARAIKKVILGLPYGPAIDMWSLGCILSELQTGLPLFPGENEADQLACIMEVLGPPPGAVLELASRRRLFFDSKGNPRCITNSKGKKRRPGSRLLNIALNTDDQEFVDFISRCLDWNSSLRMSPDEALQHSWLSSYSSQRLSSQSSLREIESESPKEQLSPEKNPENRRGSRRGTTKDLLREDPGCPREYEDPLEDSGTFLPSIL